MKRYVALILLLAAITLLPPLGFFNHGSALQFFTFYGFKPLWDFPLAPTLCWQLVRPELENGEFICYYRILWFVLLLEYLAIYDFWRIVSLHLKSKLSSKMIGGYIVATLLPMITIVAFCLFLLFQIPLEMQYPKNGYYSYILDSLDGLLGSTFWIIGYISAVVCACMPELWFRSYRGPLILFLLSLAIGICGFRLLMVYG